MLAWNEDVALVTSQDTNIIGKTTKKTEATVHAARKKEYQKRVIITTKSEREARDINEGRMHLKSEVEVVTLVVQTSSVWQAHCWSEFMFIGMINH